MRQQLGLIAMTFVIGVAGCTPQQPKIPQELQYQPPALGTPAATIVGSEEHEAVLDNHTGFIASVDGKAVMSGRAGWNNPLPIVAGPRVLTVMFQHGVYSCGTDMALQVSAGAHYQLRWENDIAAFSNKSYCNFWIADLVTGKPVTDVAHATPTGGGGGSPMPIVIPAH